MSTITQFPRGLSDPQGWRIDVPLSTLFARFVHPVITTAGKNSLPGWAPCTFAHDYRNLANFERAYAVGLDVEKGETSFDTTRALWAEFSCFVHSTYSHTPEAHRLRVIFPTSRPIATATEYKRVRRWLARQSNNAGQHCDEHASDPSRFWFVPGTAPGAEYLFHESQGETLDVEAVLALEPAEAEHASFAPVIPIRPTTCIIERAQKYLDKCDIAISGSGGHTTTFMVAQKLVRGFQLDEQTAFELMLSWNARCEPPWTQKDLRRKIHEAATAGKYPTGKLLERRGSW